MAEHKFGREVARKTINPLLNSKVQIELSNHKIDPNHSHKQLELTKRMKIVPHSMESMAEVAKNAKSLTKLLVIQSTILEF